MKKKFLISLLIVPILLIGLLGLNSNTFLVFAAGTADAYGDQINTVDVFQYVDSAWVWKGQVTKTNYTSGIQVKVDALTETRFNCSVLLNSTFASSTSEAITNTRVYLNITYANGTTVIATTEITDYAATGPTGNQYTVYSYYLWNDPTHHPIAGTTYYVWFKYDVYR